MAIAQTENTQPAPLPVENMAKLILDRVPDPALDGAISLLETSRGIEAVKDADTCALALRYAADLNKSIKLITEHYAPYNKAANDLRNGMAQLRDKTLEPFQKEIERAKGMALTFERSERARIAEENRIAELKAREAQEAEKQRIEDEALAKANDLAAAGKGEEAKAVLNQAVMEIEEVKAAPIVIAPQAPSGIRSGGASIPKKYTFEEDPEAGGLLALVVAAAKNPDAFLHYLCLSDQVSKACNAQGERFRLPGYRTVPKESIRLASSR